MSKEPLKKSLRRRSAGSWHASLCATPDGAPCWRAKRQSCRFVRGARPLAYLLDRSQVQCSVRLYPRKGVASYPARSLFQRFPNSSRCGLTAPKGAPSLRKGGRAMQELLPGPPTSNTTVLRWLLIRNSYLERESDNPFGNPAIGGIVITTADAEIEIVILERYVHHCEQVIHPL